MIKAVLRLLFLIGLYAFDVFRLQAADKPNILILFTDDHRYSGIYGDMENQVQTPHINALAAQGTRFENACLMGSFTGATCIPSRAMLNTGRHLFSLAESGWQIPQSHTTLGEAFQEAGYHTHMVGKWHQDRGSLARSFNSGAAIMGLGVYLQDHYRMPLWDWDPNGIFPKEAAYLLTYDKHGDVRRRLVSAEDQRGPLANENTGPHTSEIFADSASRFLRAYNKEEPFLLYLAFHAPHDPRQAPEAYRAMYPSDSLLLPPSYLPQHGFDNGHMYIRDEILVSAPRSVQAAQQELADYFAIITHLDAQIGKVLQALKESGYAENTVVLLAGDSGLAVGNHGLLGKQNVYHEDGVHVPLVLYDGRSASQPKRVEALCYIHDILPTLCEMAGLPVPVSANGRSLVSVLTGDSTVYEYSYHAYRQHQRAYRQGDFKLIEYVRAPDTYRGGSLIAGSRVTQLFNLADDPWEVNNLAAFPEYHLLVDSLRNGMKMARDYYGDDRVHSGNEYHFWDYYD